VLSRCDVAVSFGKVAALLPVPVASWPVGVARCPSFHSYILLWSSESAVAAFFAAFPFFGLAVLLLTLGLFDDWPPEVCAVATLLTPKTIAVARSIRFMLFYLMENRCLISSTNALPEPRM
jgi:hypothetical protein